MKFSTRLRWLLALLVLDLVVVAALCRLSNGQQIYLRNLVFSSIYSDREIGNEAGIEQRLAAGFRNGGSPTEYAEYLEVNKLRQLKIVARNSGDDTRALAVALTRMLEHTGDGTICGVESLSNVVHDTALGKGCCSDFSKAWIFYARALDMQVREVHNMTHTMVEYFDRTSRRWQMVDPYNHIQIVDLDNQPLSHFRIRTQNLFVAYRAIALLPGGPDFDVAGYLGYAQTQYASLMWTMGVNYLEIEAWDRQLRKLHLPKQIRQLFLLTIGIHPGWTMLTTNTLAMYLRLLQAILVGGIWLLGLMHLAVLATAVLARWRGAAPAPVPAAA